MEKYDKERDSRMFTIFIITSVTVGDIRMIQEQVISPKSLYIKILPVVAVKSEALNVL